MTLGSNWKRSFGALYFAVGVASAIYTYSRTSNLEQASYAVPLWPVLMPVLAYRDHVASRALSPVAPAPAGSKRLAQIVLEVAVGTPSYLTQAVYDEFWTYFPDGTKGRAFRNVTGIYTVLLTRREDWCTDALDSLASGTPKKSARRAAMEEWLLKVNPDLSALFQNEDAVIELVAHRKPVGQQLLAVTTDDGLVAPELKESIRGDSSFVYDEFTLNRMLQKTREGRSNLEKLFTPSLTSFPPDQR